MLIVCHGRRLQCQITMRVRLWLVLITPMLCQQLSRSNRSVSGRAKFKNHLRKLKVLLCLAITVGSLVLVDVLARSLFRVLFLLRPNLLRVCHDHRIALPEVS